ncbi:MAG: hypothetical protein WA899_09395, partial [Candidatus Sulfotelmatobacter sp.]
MEATTKSAADVGDVNEVKVRGGKGVLNGTPFLICLTSRQPAAVFFYVCGLSTYYTELEQDPEADERRRMNRLGVADRRGRPGRYARNDGRPWLLIAVFILAGQLLSGPEAIAQTCEDDNPWQAAALIDQIRTSCERNNVPYGADIYGLASVADREAIPALRKLAAWPTDKAPGAGCQGWVVAARAALVKLGDEDYRAGLDLSFLSFVGDDRALAALVEFLIAHAKDPAMLQDFGDYEVDRRDGILKDIDTIRRRRRAPDLPTADYSDAGIAQWKAYLEKRKGQQLTFPAYPIVDDPYLR